MKRHLWKMILACVLGLSEPAFPTAWDYNGTTTDTQDTNLPTGLNTNTFSAGCWIRREGPGEGNVGKIFDVTQDESSPGTGWVLRWVNADSEYIFQAWTTSTAGQWDLADANVGTNAWRHLAFTANLSTISNGPVWYVDGILVSGGVQQAPVGTFVLPELTDAIIIGGATATTWDGQLASCFMYSRVLSAGEVKQVARFGPHTVRRGLIWCAHMGLFEGRDCSNTAHPALSTTDTIIVNTGPPVTVPQGGWWE